MNIKMTFKAHGKIAMFLMGLKIVIKSVFTKARQRDWTNFLSRGFAVLEDQDLPVRNVYMNAKTYRECRVNLEHSFDPVAHKDLLKRGYMGDFWNASLRLDKNLKDGEVVFTTEEHEHKDAA